LFQIEKSNDKDNARKDEIAELGEQTSTGINIFSAVFVRLKEVRFFSFSISIFIILIIILVSRGEGKTRTLDHLNCCVLGKIIGCG